MALCITGLLDRLLTTLAFLIDSCYFGLSKVGTRTTLTTGGERELPGI